MSAMFSKTSPLNPMSSISTMSKTSQQMSALDPIGTTVRKKTGRAATDLLNDTTPLGQAKPAISSARALGAL